MSRLKLWLGVLMVFILGAAAGSFGVIQYHQHRFGHIMEAPGEGPVMPFPPKVMLPRLLDRLDQELNLTASQKKKIRIILEDAMNSFETFRAEYHPQMIAIKEKADARIKALLQPDQIGKFNDMTKRFKKHPPPPPPMSGFQGEMMDGPPPEFIMGGMERQLHLKPEQREKVRAILDENFSQRREALMKLKLGETGTHGGIKQKISELNKETEKKLQPILDADQLGILRKIMDENTEPRHDW
ncbi:MAG: hypothetical protein ABIK15_00840 [Pseudomonadota bacterium]